jgi:hypothetical protein
MAIAGGAAPCVAMRIVDGKLVMGRREMAQGVINDFDRAIALLFDGESIFVSVYGGLHGNVERTVRMTLEQHGSHHAK